MPDPLSIGIATTAAGVALAAGWMQWPSSPELDGERWFKLTLATLLLGQTEADGGDDQRWIDQVHRFVPYHPAGRHPERKVVQPLADPPGERLDGERALQEKLATLDGLAARWAWMYDQDELGQHARLADPAELGDDYDPKPLMGRGWDDLASWGAGASTFRDDLLRSVGCHWVVVEGRPDRAAGPYLADAFASELEQLTRVPWSDSPIEERVAALQQQLEALDGTPHLIVIGEEAGIALVLRALQGHAGLRDQVLAVLSVGGVIGGRDGEEGPFGAKDAQDWLSAWFSLEHFDSEIVRLTPFLSVQWLDRTAPTPGSAGLRLEHQRFPEPRDDGTIATLEAVDLGPLQVEPEPPVVQVARALIAVTGLWTISRNR